MKGARILGILVLAALSAAAQPYINYRGVVNAASFEGQGLPAGSIAQGSVFTIFGSNLGPAQYAQSSSYPLPNKLAGVSLSITQTATTLAAIPLIVLASQVSAIMPSNAPLGKVIVRVNYNGQTSNPAIVNVVPASPGVFSVLSSGFGPGVVQNYASAASQPINTTQATAQPGQTVILWGTGLGPVPYGDNVAPAAGNLPTQVSVFIGNQPASVSYSGRSPCCAGLDEIIVTVPADSPSGCYVPVQVMANSSVVSNAVTIGIDKNGAPCADSFNPGGGAVRAGGNHGFVQAERDNFVADIGLSAPGEAIADSLFVDLRQDAGGPSYFSPEYSLPPVGTCTMYSGQAFDSGAGTLLFAPQSKALDGGAALQVSAGGAMASVKRFADAPQLYGALLGEQPAPSGTSGLFFGFPGPFTLSIPGGADVHSAQVNGATPAPLQWTEQTSLSTLVRANGLTVHWTGGNPATDVAVIEVLDNNDAANSSTLALCLAPLTAGKFSLPAEILQSLPATPASAQRIPALVVVASEPLLSPATFSAGGLQGGFLTPVYAAIASVVVE